MKLYVWAKSAFFKGNPMDHTWVTSYHLSSVSYKDIRDVINNHQKYWFCKGDFHSTAGTPKFPVGLLTSRSSTDSSAWTSPALLDKS